LTFLDGLIVRDIDSVKKTKYSHLFGEDPKVKWPMRIWGKAGMIRITGKVKSKLDMRGARAMFVGFARGNTVDMYCMYVPELNSVHKTRDVQWAKKMFVEPEMPVLIQAADLVDLMLNRNLVLLRTVLKVNPPPNDVPARREGGSHVKFARNAEIILDNEPFVQDQEEELSTMTSSRVEKKGGGEKLPAQHATENFYAILADLGRIIF
jgi:hypothetical protein